jgi:hypothetical protein
MNGFTFTCDDWVTSYVTEGGALVVKCARCGASHTEPPAPHLPPIEEARIRCQNFSNEHGDCLGYPILLGDWVLWERGRGPRRWNVREQAWEPPL